MDRTEIAFQQGRRAYIDGLLPTECPFEDGTPEDTSWLLGWKNERDVRRMLMEDILVF